LNQTKERKYKNKNKICFGKKKKEKGKGSRKSLTQDTFFRFKIVYWYHSSFGFQTKQVFIFILF